MLMNGEAAAITVEMVITAIAPVHRALSVYPAFLHFVSFNTYDSTASPLVLILPKRSSLQKR